MCPPSYPANQSVVLPPSGQVVGCGKYSRIFSVCTNMKPKTGRVLSVCLSACEQLVFHPACYILQAGYVRPFIQSVSQFVELVEYLCKVTESSGHWQDDMSACDIFQTASFHTLELVSICIWTELFVQTTYFLIHAMYVLWHQVI